MPKWPIQKGKKSHLVVLFWSAGVNNIVCARKKIILENFVHKIFIKMSALRTGRAWALHLISRRASSVAFPKTSNSPMLKSFTNLKVLSLGENMQRCFASSVALNRQEDDTTVQKATDRMETKMHSMNLHVQKSGRVIQSDLEDLLKLMEISGSFMSTHVLFALRCCGSNLVDVPSKDRRQVTDRVWSLLLKHKVKLDISHYNTLLRVYLDNDQAFSPTEILGSIESRGLQPNRVTYQHLVAKFCKVFYDKITKGSLFNCVFRMAISQERPPFWNT